MRILDRKKDSFCASCPFKSHLLNPLKHEQLNFLNETRIEKTYKKGEWIITQDDPIDRLFYVKDGLVKLFITDDHGKDHILSLGKAFDFLGLLSVFSGENYKYSVTAIKETTVCSLELSKVKTLIKENGEFALLMLNTISKTNDQLINFSYEVTKRQLKGRVAFFLILLSRKFFKSNQFDLPISRRETAEVLQVTTENVIRCLSEFRKDDLIEINGKGIKILNFEMLRKISNLG